MRKNQADPQPEKADNTSIEDKNRRLAILAARAMHEQRAENIMVIDLRKLVDYADYFVIGSASSMARMRGIVRRVEKIMLKNGGKRLNQPDRDAAWALADFGDILVHVFDTKARDFYQLEDLWLDAPKLKWQETKEETNAKGQNNQ